MKKSVLKKGVTPKVPGTFENPMNNERWFCDDINFVKLIDGFEFIWVYNETVKQPRLMKKTALRLIKRVK